MAEYKSKQRKTIEKEVDAHEISASESTSTTNHISPFIFWVWDPSLVRVCTMICGINYNLIVSRFNERTNRMQRIIFHIDHEPCRTLSIQQIMWANLGIWCCHLTRSMSVCRNSNETRGEINCQKYLQFCGWVFVCGCAIIVIIIKPYKRWSTETLKTECLCIGCVCGASLDRQIKMIGSQHGIGIQPPRWWEFYCERIPLASLSALASHTPAAFTSYKCTIVNLPQMIMIETISNDWRDYTTIKLCVLIGRNCK